MSADLIEHHFCQIQGIDGVPCTYLMCKTLIPPIMVHCSDEHAESFNDQMIKHNPIIKSTEFLSHVLAPDVAPLSLYTHKEVEDNACCFQELKRIIQGTEAKVYVDEFNVHSEFWAAWRKLWNTFLSSGAKDMLAAQLERTIQNLWCSKPKHGFTFSTYVKRHKTVYQSMLALVFVWTILSTTPALASAIS